MVQFYIELPGRGVAKHDGAEVGIWKGSSWYVRFRIQVEDSLTDGIDLALGNSVVHELWPYASVALWHTLAGIKDRRSGRRKVSPSLVIGWDIAVKIDRIFLAGLLKIHKEKSLVL